MFKILLAVGGEDQEEILLSPSVPLPARNRKALLGVESRWGVRGERDSK